MTATARRSRTPRRSGTWSNRLCWPTRWVSTSSGSVSITPGGLRDDVRGCGFRRDRRPHPQIRLGSAVTVLSSDDPVRVFQRFATLDAVSSGRAEVILGRGSCIESFPLFGYDLADYDKLFEEKARLFAAFRTGSRSPGGATVARPGRAIRLSAYRIGRVQDLARRRRQPGVGGAGRALRIRPCAGHYRRRARPGLRRSPSCSTGRRPSSARRRRRSAVHSPGHVADTDSKQGRALAAVARHDARIASGTRIRRYPTRAAASEGRRPEGSMYVGVAGDRGQVRSPPTCARSALTAST